MPSVHLLPPADFEPLALSLDDRLEVDLQLVLGYRHRIDSGMLSAALSAGFESFPHLTGSIERSDSAQWRIVPSSRAVRFEVCEVMETPPQATAFTQNAWGAGLLPDPGEEPRSLFSIRLTRAADGGADVLALRVSHAAVDGTGLGWFARCAAMAAMGKAAPKVIHNRNLITAGTLADALVPPSGYRDIGNLTSTWAWPPDPWLACAPVVFAVPVSAIRAATTPRGSLLDQRLYLTAMLCAELACIAPGLKELAIWCDPRGGGLIPSNFTGNAGCYLPLPLRGQPPEQLAAAFRQLASRRGFRAAAESWLRIKQAESRGRMFVWDGPREDVLQINLLPRAIAGADLGGPPDFGFLLSRNSSGLRISITPDGKAFLIEAGLADGWGEALIEAVRVRGLDPRPWHWCTQPNQETS